MRYTSIRPFVGCMEDAFAYIISQKKRAWLNYYNNIVLIITNSNNHNNNRKNNYIITIIMIHNNMVTMKIVRTILFVYHRLFLLQLV